MHSVHTRWKDMCKVQCQTMEWQSQSVFQGLFFGAPKAPLYCFQFGFSMASCSYDVYMYVCIALYINNYFKHHHHHHHHHTVQVAIIVLVNALVL